MNASFINLKLRIQFRNTAVINLLYEQICNCVTFTYDGRKGLFFFVMLCYTHVCCAMCRCVDCNLLLSSEEEGRGCYPLGRTGDSDSLFFVLFFFLSIYPQQVLQIRAFYGLLRVFFSDNKLAPKPSQKSSLS